MTWNYRVIEHRNPTSFQIHEVYYDKNLEVIGVTEEMIAPIGDTFIELSDELSNMLGACEMPILNYDDY